MKKIILTILLGLFFQIATPASDTNLTFMYINGSNNNDSKMKNWYINGVNKLHPVLKKKFETDPTIKNWARDNKLVIAKEPQIFFWGYNSKTDLEFVKDRLDISKAFSSILAYEIRSLLTQFMHDALWIQKSHNMLPILDNLNDEIKAQADNNQNVILYGYSAGTFVNYQYMLYKLPYIDMGKLFYEIAPNSEISELANKKPKQKTCLSALNYDKGNIGTISNTGTLVLNQDEKELENNYLNMDEITNKYCAPEGYVRGVVNFASPIPLFYSDIGDENYKLNYYNKYLLKYIMEHGIYYLTVNFREDPLGFPSSRNLTIPQLEERINMTLENPTGVVYDLSSVWSKRSALLAHTSYWTARRTFANGVVKSFVNGRKFQYNQEYQDRIIKKRNKRSEVLQDDME